MEHSLSLDPCSMSPIDLVWLH